jgi:hypothetical protein
MKKIVADTVTGFLSGGANAVEKVAGVFTSNAERDAQRSADEQMALLDAYKQEFQKVENRNWVDSLADGFNRLIRPVIVIIIIFVFILAYISPGRFAEISLAMSSIPNGYWALLSVIIGFYFGGRMQIKGQDFQFKQSQAEAVKALIGTRNEFRKLAMDTDEPDKAIGDSVAKDTQIDTKRSEQRNSVIEAYLKTDEAQRKGKLKTTVKRLKHETDEATVNRGNTFLEEWH